MRSQGAHAGARLARRGRSAPALRGELILPGMRVGLFGGSFNPAHEGHVHVARTALARLGLHRLWWLVSPQNPLKDAAETDLYERRFAQTLAAADHPRMTVTDIEARVGARYTVDALAALCARWPHTRFVWVMGADNLAGFHRWRGWTDIMDMLPILVIARPGQALRARLSPAARRYAAARLPAEAARALPDAAPPAWCYLPAPLHPASSTALRASAKKRKRTKRAKG